MKITGDEYFDSAEFRQLLDNYEKAVNAGEPVFMDAYELAEIADYYQMTGAMDNAEKAITLALSLAPGAIAPLTYRIHEALYKGDTALAWQLLDQVEDKDAPDYVYNRAEILLAEGHATEADRYLKEEFKHVPANEYQDYVIDVARILSDYGEDELAMEWIKKARHEDTPDYQELMGQTLFRLGKYKESEQIFAKLIDRDPFSKKYWNALASAQFMIEDYGNAIESSEYAIAIDPNDPDGLLSKANGLERLGNYEEALKYFRRYSQQMPDDPFALIHQAQCLMNINQSEEAIPLLNQVLEMAPEDAPELYDIYMDLSFAYSEAGNHKKAMECLSKTDALDCDHEQVDVVKGHVMLSAGFWQEATTYFQKALKESSDMAKTVLRIFVSLYDNDMLEQARELYLEFRETIESHNEQQVVGLGYAYMALCSHDMQDHERFLSYLEKACAISPDSCRRVVGHLFPESVTPENYYIYIKDQLNDQL